MPLDSHAATPTTAREFATEVYCAAHQCGEQDLDPHSGDLQYIDQITALVANRDALLLARAISERVARA